MISIRPIDRSILRYKNLVYKVANNIEAPTLEIKEDLIQNGWLYLINTLKNKKVNSKFNLIKYMLKYMRLYLYRQLYKMSKPRVAREAYDKDISDDNETIELLDRKILYGQVKSLFYSVRYMINPVHFEILEYYFGYKNLNGINNPTSRDIAKVLNLDISYVAQVIYKAKLRFNNIKGFTNV